MSGKRYNNNKDKKNNIINRLIGSGQNKSTNKKANGKTLDYLKRRNLEEENFIPKAFQNKDKTKAKKDTKGGDGREDTIPSFSKLALDKAQLNKTNTNKTNADKTNFNKVSTNNANTNKTNTENTNNANAKNDKNKKAKHPRLKKALIIIIFLIIASSIIGLVISASSWRKIAKQMLINQNSTVVDSSNNVLATLGSERKQNKISLSEMPSNLKNAYVSIEDERFYKHTGVDIKRTSAAIASYVFHFGSSSYGGSTITQQLVKNMTGDNTDSISRKVKEWWKAYNLEGIASKDKILETYLNIIYVGPSIYGVDAGSQYYFSKSAKSLSLEECAFLAGINNSPNSYSPFGDKDNSEKISKRTKTVLDKMLELKYITQDEHDKAVANVNKGLNFKQGNINSGNGVYSYHTDALISDVTKDISKKYNISNTFATNYINMAGLKIKSTQDAKIQKQTETEMSKPKYIVASKKGNDHSQAAMVIIDHKTGNVLACVGALGEKSDPRSLNRAVQSIRQTGSAIKPIAVVGPAIQKNIITGASIFDDTEQDFPGNYHPVDYSKSLGKITVRRAIESSQNIPFVEIMQKLKPTVSMEYMKKLGVTTLTDGDNSLALALGGLQKGISPLEMAAAYATIANNGQYIEPTFYSEVDYNSSYNSGEKMMAPNQAKRQVFSKDTAYILQELLTQPVIGSNGTATYCKIDGIDVAAKTGTTDSNYDRWLCGFTPYYTGVTWFGYDQNESVEFNQRNPAGLIWANVMSRIHAGLKGTTFTKPAMVQEAMIDPTTGLKARSSCPNPYKEYFRMFTVPGLCTEHSGTELKPNSDAGSKIKDTIQGIMNDIDAKEPILNTNTTNNRNDNPEEGNNTLNNSGSSGASSGSNSNSNGSSLNGSGGSAGASSNLNSNNSGNRHNSNTNSSGSSSGGSSSSSGSNTNRNNTPNTNSSGSSSSSGSSGGNSGSNSGSSSGSSGNSGSTSSNNSGSSESHSGGSVSSSSE